MTLAKATLSAVSITLAAFAVFAGEAHRLGELDANRDGLLSVSEAFPNPQLSNNFRTIDANADGFLSAAKISAAFGR